MADFQNELSKHKSPDGEQGQKCCKICGAPTNNPRFDTCFKHKDKSTWGAGREQAELPKEYLKQGYFDSNGVLFERYLKRNGDADDIAKGLSSFRDFKNHQLRRFYGHIRAADNILKMTGNFPAVKVELQKLAAFVAEAYGKKKVPKIFYDFINKNIEYIKTEMDFREGFLAHFQAVVGFFTYYKPKE